MNYYEARQTKDKQFWHWTCMNDGKVWPSTPCTSDCQHKTSEEAERHHYDHEVASLQTVTFSSAQKCEVCGVWTPKALQTRGGLRASYLCDEHLTKENWAKKFPFETGIQISSSW
jgi:hypothetical protein